jgi:hypothetical protein
MYDLRFGLNLAPNTCGLNLAPNTCGLNQAPNTCGLNPAPNTCGLNLAPNTCGLNLAPNTCGLSLAPNTCGLNLATKTHDRKGLYINQMPTSCDSECVVHLAPTPLRSGLDETSSISAKQIPEADPDSRSRTQCFLLLEEPSSTQH